MFGLAKHGLAILLLASCANPAARSTPSAQASRQANMGSDSKEFYPGILVDSSGEVAFARTAGGGLAAIRLASGDFLWETEFSYTPLFEVQGVLAALAPSRDQSNVFRVAWLDARRGSVSKTSDEVVLPDWVSVEPTRGRQFQASVDRRGQDLVLHWQARAFYAGGARPTQAILDASKKEAAGDLQIGPGSQSVKMLTSQSPGASALLPARLANLKSWQYRAADEWRTTPLILADRAVTLELASTGTDQQLAAVSWDLSTGRQLSRVVLTAGTSLWAMVSSDNGSLFVASTAPQALTAWKVFSLADGKQRGILESEHRLVAGQVTGSIALVLADPDAGQDHLLQAFELGSGKLNWSVPLLGPIRFQPAR